MKGHSFIRIVAGFTALAFLTVGMNMLLAPASANTRTSPCTGIPVSGSGIAFGRGTAHFTGTLTVQDFMVNPYESNEIIAIGAVTGVLTLKNGEVIGEIANQGLIGPIKVVDIQADTESSRLVIDLSGNAFNALGSDVGIDSSTLTITGRQANGLIHSLSSLLRASQYDAIANQLNAICPATTTPIYH